MGSVDTLLVSRIRAALHAAADPAKAEPMRAYMKSELPFLGAAKPQRTQALGPVIEAPPLANRDDWEATVRWLWDDAQFREERYAATQLAQAAPYASWASQPAAIALYDHMIVTGAWWDHVDDLAIRSVGPTLRTHHSALAPVIRGWSSDSDRWRRRASVICHVGAGADLDVDLLRDCVLATIDDNDVFIRKGIGWALRQHSRTDPGWVQQFVSDHESRLSPLSRREALRLIGPGVSPA